MAACYKLGHKYFESGSYNMNVIGIRNSDPGKKVTNVFDDWMTLSYKDDKGTWQFHKWACTTDPGTKAMKEFHNAGGVARVVPGQYPASHAVGLHQGKYKALKQCGPVKVYRDWDKDMVYDETKTETGIFGINIHHAGADSASNNQPDRSTYSSPNVLAYNTAHVFSLSTSIPQPHGQAFCSAYSPSYFEPHCYAHTSAFT